MANQYGTIGMLGETILTAPQMHSNAPVYVGLAPLHLASRPATVNRPVLVRSFAEAAQLLGFSDDFERYDLCEAIDAHFLNRIQPVGPICCINVFDPTAPGATKATPITVSVTLSGGIGYIADQDCVIATIEIEGKELGTDYAVVFDANSRRVRITDLTGTMESPVTVTYKRADISLITAAEIIGESHDDGNKTGIKAIGYVYQTLGVVPAFLCAPMWGGDEAVHAALIAASQAVSGRFYAMVPGDIAVSNATVSEAIMSKTVERMTGEMELPGWPRAYKGSQRYHFSVLTIVASMQTDLRNGGIPFESADNKPIDIDGTCLALDRPILLDIDQADRLKAAGMRTGLRWGGVWRLWGSHTGAYGEADESDRRAIFDSGMRMLYYVLNVFTQRYFDEIGRPMTRNRLDSIVKDVNAWLDSLVSMGALLFAAAEPMPEILADDMVMGRIRLKLRATSTPPIGLITAVLSYTDEGLNLLIEGGN